MPGTNDPLAQALALLAGVPQPGGRKRPKRQKFLPLTPAAPPKKPFTQSASGKPAPEY